MKGSPGDSGHKECDPNGSCLYTLEVASEIPPVCSHTPSPKLRPARSRFPQLLFALVLARVVVSQTLGEKLLSSSQPKRDQITSPAFFSWGSMLTATVRGVAKKWRILSKRPTAPARASLLHGVPWQPAQRFCELLTSCGRVSSLAGHYDAGCKLRAVFAANSHCQPVWCALLRAAVECLL